MIVDILIHIGEGDQGKATEIIKSRFNPDFFQSSFFILCIVIKYLKNIELAKSLFLKFNKNIQGDVWFYQALDCYLRDGYIIVSDDSYIKKILAYWFGKDKIFEQKKFNSKNSNQFKVDFDPIKSIVVINDKEISIKNKPILKRILILILSNPEKKHKLDVFYKNIWKVNFIKEEDISKVNSTIFRLNKLLGVSLIKNHNQQIFIPDNIAIRSIKNITYDECFLNTRQLWIVDFLEKNKEIDSQTIADNFDCNLRSVQRDLKVLIQAKKIEKKGNLYVKFSKGSV